MDAQVDLNSLPRPRAFFSYTWDSEDHKEWVKSLAARLRAAGINLSLDQWEVRPGDQLPHFMERAVRDSDFVLCVCTPRYKQRFDARTGGAGYEANLMSAEALATGNERKFVAVLRAGEPFDSLPSWLLGKRFLDFRGESYADSSYETLVAHLHGLSAQPPPVRVSGTGSSDLLAPTSVARQDRYPDFINAAIKVFQAANGRLLLYSKNNAAARVLLRDVERELEQQANRVNELLQTFGQQSSEEVQKAAVEVAGWVLAAKLTSMHPGLADKNKEAYARFLKESLPRFRDATRKERGLR